MSIRLASLGKLDQRPGEKVFLVTRWATRWIRKYVAQSPTWFQIPDLAPSVRLLTAFQRNRIEWKEFAKRYREEMKEPKPRDLIRRLRRYAEDHDVVLVCYCREEARCHRKLLKEIIEEDTISSNAPG